MEAAKASEARWQGIDHVQLAIPAGGESAAREFYGGLLGLTEVPKPSALAARGGAWFEAGTTRIHVGIESSGTEVRWSDEIPGVERCHIFDPFGNRIELVEVGSRS